MMSTHKEFELQKYIEHDTIETCVKLMAKRISEDYRGLNPLLVIILKGSFIFGADLCRNLDIDFNIDFLSCKSYGASTQSSGIVQLIKDLDASIQGQHIILIEDILDTGLTLGYLEEYLKLKHPASLEIACLFIKKVERKVNIDIKYKGLELDDDFVVGFGMDFDQRFRGLPYVAKVVFKKHP
jgi:hypoxanthine phosphoribosyltransferase